MKIVVRPLSEITIARYMSMREVLDFTPAYQREGGIWSRQTRSRLIDSIINGLDVPKLYFERARARHTTGEGRTIQYSVLDGKQRLESIAEYVSDDLPLPSDFRFYEDDNVDAAGLTFTELRRKYALLAQRVLDYELPIIEVRSDSVDLIEEMFQRLNASTALNNAERRNAVSGPTRDAANTLAEHPLLTQRSPIKDSRYKYRELAAKFLAIEHQIATNDRILDTKAATLYDLFLATRGDTPTITLEAMTGYRAAASETLDRLAPIFGVNDRLLGSIGTVVVYYIVARSAAFAGSITHAKLDRFDELRRAASAMGENESDYARPANVRLREYNVLVQSSNDGRALSRRAAIMSAFIVGYREDDDLAALDALADSDDPSHEIVEE